MTIKEAMDFLLVWYKIGVGFVFVGGFFLIFLFNVENSRTKMLEGVKTWLGRIVMGLTIWIFGSIVGGLVPVICFGLPMVLLGWAATF